MRDVASRRYRLPWKTVGALSAALAYFLSPIDLMPDFIPLIGLHRRRGGAWTGLRRRGSRPAALLRVARPRPARVLRRAESHGSILARRVHQRLTVATCPSRTCSSTRSGLRPAAPEAIVPAPW